MTFFSVRAEISHFYLMYFESAYINTAFVYIVCSIIPLERISSNCNTSQEKERQNIKVINEVNRNSSINKYTLDFIKASLRSFSSNKYSKFNGMGSVSSQ